MTLADSAPLKRDVPFVPTDEPALRAILKLANLTPDDTLYDIGCGDGRIVIAAALAGATAVGFDIDPQRIRDCQENVLRLSRTRHAHIAPRISFHCANLFDLDLTPANVLTIYLLPKINALLRPRLLQLRPGTRIVSNTFDMTDWQPDELMDSSSRRILKWIVPAPIAGRWKLTVRLPPPLPALHLTLRFTQTFQKLSGWARIPPAPGSGQPASGARPCVDLPLGEARITGDALTFKLPALIMHTSGSPGLPHPLPHLASATRFIARITPRDLRGSCWPESNGCPPLPFYALPLR